MSCIVMQSYEYMCTMVQFIFAEIISKQVVGMCWFIVGLLCHFTGLYCDALQVRVETGWGHPGPGQVGLTQIIKYPGLTRILHWIMCRDQPTMCLLLPIMLHYSALKIHPIMLNSMLKNRNCCHTIMLFICNLHEEFTTCNRQF